MTPPRALRRHHKAGLTLVEVMVAVTILALVATVVFGGFNQTMLNKGRIEAQADRTHIIRVAMERMVREISMAYVTTHLNPSPQLVTVRTAFIGRRAGEADRLDFTSFSHRRLYRDAHESDQNEISYFVTRHPDDFDRKVLARREQRRVDDDPQTGGSVQILVEDVRDFKLSYLDYTDGEWSDDWDSTNAAKQPNRVPYQVLIRLTVPSLSRRGKDEVFATRASPQLIWGLNHATYTR